MIKAFIYKMCPNKEELVNLKNCLENCRKLYNNLLHLENLTYALNEKFIFYYDLAKIVKNEKNLYSQIKQNVAKRLTNDLTFFLKYHKSNKKVIYPKIKDYSSYNSFTYPQCGFNIVDDFLYLSKIGKIYLNKNEVIPANGKIKSCTIVKESNTWYANIAVELL